MGRSWHSNGCYEGEIWVIRRSTMILHSLAGQYWSLTQPSDILDDSSRAADCFCIDCPIHKGYPTKYLILREECTI